MMGDVSYATWEALVQTYDEVCSQMARQKRETDEELAKLRKELSLVTNNFDKLYLAFIQHISSGNGAS